MRGTRYGDFSRFITGLRTSQTALLMQQGRIQLDADWNAQAELADRRLAGAIADVLGASGAPAAAPGFEIRPRERLEFSGQGAIRTRRHLALGLPRDGSFTIEMRVQWAGGPGTLIDLAGDRGGHLSLAVREDGVLVFSQHSSGGTKQAQVSELVSREPLTVAAAAHAAVVCRDGQGSIWVDSQQVASGRLAPAPAADRRIVVIGAAAGARGRSQGPYFTGVIGGVRIWDTARSARELGAPLPGDGAPVRGLLAWWPLEDGASAAGLEERVSGERVALDGATPPRWRLADLEVAPGRFYVEGQMVSLEEPLTLAAHLPAAEASGPLAPGRHLVYLEVWEESRSAAEDPALLEPALGGQDSVVRAELAFAVRCIEAPRAGDRDPEQLLRAALHAAGLATTGALAADHAGPPVTGNWLYRVEVHQGGHTDAELSEIDVAAVDADSGVVTLARAWTGHDPAHEGVEFVGVTPEGRLATVGRAVESVGDAPDRRTLRLLGGAAQLAELRDLRLRRPAPPPTFKWSRRNGADTITVTAVEGDPLSFDLVGGTVPIKMLAPNQVVEVLGQSAGDTDQSAAIRHIVKVHPDRHRISLNQALPDQGPALARLRLWDQAPDASPAGGVVTLTAGDWIELEHGVRVRFGSGRYRAGDYWWVPVRQDGDPVLWDRRDGHPEFHHPDGIERRQAPLALVEIENGVHVRDLRGTVRTLVRLSALDAAQDGAEPTPAEVAAAEAPAAGPPAVGPAATGADAADARATQGDDEDEEETEWLSIPSGFAVLGPAGATAPGWRPTGAEVITRRAWAAPVTLTLPDSSPPEALVAGAGGLLLVTATDIWKVEPESGEITHLTTLPEPRVRFSCAVIGDTIFLLGGRRQAAERPDGRVLSFDAGRGSWLSGRQPLMSPVDRPAAAVAAADGGPGGDAGRIHLLGGAGDRGDRPTRLHQIYDPAGDQWTEGTPLERPRKGAGAGAVAGAIYLFGGITARRSEEMPLSSTDVYDEPSRTWSEGPQLPAAGAIVCAGADGQIIVGAAPSPQQALRVAALDAEADVWRELPWPSRRVRSPAMTMFEDRLFLAGVDAAGQVVLMELPPDQRWLMFEPEEADR